MLSLSTTPGARAEAFEGADERRGAGGALRLLRDAERAADAELPTLATPSDVREAVRYLLRKPAGVSVVEAVSDAKRRVFEPRKVAAYEAWGLVERRGARVLLSPAGREFARKLAPESEAYRDLLGAEPVYRAALEWMDRQPAEVVTHADLAAHFSAHLAGPPAPPDAKTLEGAVVCFFHLCQAAELGTVTIGKRGQPARLRVEREELAAWVAGGRRARPAAARAHLKPHGAADEAAREEARASASDLPAAAGRVERGPGPKAAGGPALRLYVSCGEPASNLLAGIRNTLELVDIECRVCGRGGEPASPAVPVTDDAAELMRRCDAGLLVVTKEDCEEGAGLRRSVLVEAGAAYVLYTGRVVILFEDGLELPHALGDLPRFAFRGDSLTPEVALQLLRALKGLRPAAARAED